MKGLARSLAALPITAVLLIAAPALGQDWQSTLEKVVPSVVVLRVNATRAFDTSSPGDQVATGFVVDAKRGLILTNHHVVMDGPVVAEAMFQNHEEVPVEAIYRDPVHDFGFYRFDPAAVRFMPIRALELAPQHAKVGSEIRVIGNDAGEKLSILAGTLARLDRAAPHYGPNTYNDFNTFYFQAASGTSGGSSGSPVVDIRGRVIALNAGGKRFAASSFYLPLDRVVRALEKIRAELPVTRGTLQTVFLHRSYDELRRLGLRPESEALMRKAFPNGTGLIVASEVVPGGPADGKLQPGDILLRIDGKPLDSFLPLERVLDDRVGGTLVLDVERGGTPYSLELAIGDLHAITPADYLEIGGAVVHDLSFQQARNFSVPVQGVYVAYPGYALGGAGVPRGAVITELAGQATPSAEDFERVAAGVADRERVPLRYTLLGQPGTPQLTVMRMDRTWHRMARCRRDDSTGRWPCVDSPPPPPAKPQQPTTSALASAPDGPAEKLAASLVMVDFEIPYMLDGVHADRFQGAGLVVDAERGLVVVDRETVPVALGDCQLTFGGSLRVPGTVRYLHPEHNFAVVGYDPALLGETPIRSAALDDSELEVGDDTWLVGLSSQHQIVAKKTEVERLQPLALAVPSPPRFRDMNLRVLRLADSTPTVGGVLANRRGHVQALWASYSYSASDGPHSFFAGIPIQRVMEGIAPLLRDGEPHWHTLGIELQAMPLADARERGLSSEDAARIEDAAGEDRRVLSVVRVAAAGASDGLIAPGDILLDVNGAPAVEFHQLEAAAQLGRVKLRLLSGESIREVEIDGQVQSGLGTRRAIVWAGALLQDSPNDLALQRGIEPFGVYVAWFWFGSPAQRYGLRATQRIVEVDGQPTPNLDALLLAVRAKTDEGALRLKLVGLDGRPEVITLKLDLAYWPTVELERAGDRWTVTRREPGSKGETMGSAR